MTTQRILLTGQTGYMSQRLHDFLTREGYRVDQISLRSQNWHHHTFEHYDTVIHLAALVHNNQPDATMVDYMNVNYHLTRQLAVKAKAEGVRHFIFFSTMAIYGKEGRLNQSEEINQTTEATPKTPYGISKYKAEQMLLKMHGDTFKVAILRPPMIYGKNAPGNFSKLIKLAKFVPVYPKIDNQRSVLYIETLEKYIKETIETKAYGIFHPQNAEYMSTNAAIQEMRRVMGKSTYCVKVPRFILKSIAHISIIQKIYGNLFYSQNIDGLQRKIEQDKIEITFRKTL
ncbi:NAD-dependent epimerase/dehydratase family protein [Staphylococcus canis]|uniref:NAD-dependent epimerase/dehydratase family protein n=1 Tax=Staphylococcus canis TaxID=2724942 RepID=A0ABS0TA78_9STAP|nr:NAD-dependent epimerase/dehydratase family protein [Staphylococcus canis]MBI5975582.1 NAD-dependent epimerase/dehydratase family protein [Staphylococcus canis]